ncbi:alpha/beta hydrolase [Sphaerisporangium sp. NPDC049002]|uniref:alpha/beta hydrolase n=1 Tax=unclassified Sphaerisporangium TaxID=2630420 RepID=UPI0033E9A3A7
MATFVLVPGAASGPWYWHLLATELRERGHDVVAADVPCDDDSAGLSEYADAVVDAIGDRTGLVLVAHSFGGFTAPLVCDRMPVDLLVMLQAMVPSPGEPPGAWWANTGHQPASPEPAEHEGGDTGGGDDVIATYFHDVPPELAAEAIEKGRGQSGTPMGRPWPLDRWPDVPVKFLLCSEDRLFPADFMRRVVRERLGVTPDEIPTGHLPMLSRPKELAERLVAYVNHR